MPLEVVAQACAIGIDDIETRHHQPCVAGCGAPFILAELKERRALTAAQPRADVFARHLPRDGATGIHLYVHTVYADRDEGADIQCRMFAPLHGIPEDPATGSANVALIGLLARLQGPDLQLAKDRARASTLGRPSLLLARAEKTAGVVTATTIGGTCVPVMRGTLGACLGAGCQQPTSAD
jgi:trans-2,3-dihydro-3-hydroxyanthranilate isomerase